MSEEMGLQLILSKLDKMDNDMQEMKTDIRELKRDVQVLKEEVQVLKEDVQILKGKVLVLQEDVETLKPLEAKFDYLAMLIENEVRRMVNVVAEGHGVLNDRMDAVQTLYKDKEQMKVEILDLRIDVKDIKKAIAMA